MAVDLDKWFEAVSMLVGTDDIDREDLKYYRNHFEEVKALAELAVMTFQGAYIKRSPNDDKEGATD